MKQKRMICNQIKGVAQLTREQLKQILGGQQPSGGAITSCSCTGVRAMAGDWVEVEFHYASNNGDCTPGNGHLYNFGTAYTYVNGEYQGATDYSGITGESNINTYLSSCN